MVRHDTLGIPISIFLFSSCSRETLETSSPTLLQDQTQKLALAPNPANLIQIENKSGDSGNSAAQKGPNDRGRFDISLKYVVQPTPRQIEVFEAAAARWERIIIKDVPSIEGPVPSAFIGFPDIEGTIDDIVIELAIAPIDGPGRILGQAGPRFARLSDYLTLIGFMLFWTWMSWTCLRR